MNKARTEAAQVAARKAKSRGISVSGVGGYSHHILVCVGNGCCEGRDHRDTIKALNRRIQAAKRQDRFIYLTIVQCLNFCRSGPLLVVYPDGTWYHSATSAAVERIFDEHILGGRVVAELAFAQNPMTNP